MMPWYEWIFYIATLPFALLGIAAIVSAVFYSWVLLFAICGAKWAQRVWSNI